jgi:hypothetical protein
MRSRSRTVLVTTAVAMLVIAWRSRAADTPAAPAAPAATAPSTRPSTWHDYLAGQHAYYREQFVESYKRVGKHGPWDDDAVKFLDRCAFGSAYASARMLYKPPGVPSHDELIAAGKAVLDAGCTDPLVRYQYSLALRGAGREKDAIAPAGAAAADMEKAGYPAFCVWAAAVHLRRLEPDPESAARLRPAINAAAIKMVSGKLGDAARRLLVERLYGDLLGELFATQTEFIERQLDASPGVDPWVREVLDGYVKLAIGWDMFGRPMDEEKTQQQLDYFRQARERFAAASRLAPQLPEPAVKMIQISMMRGKELGERPITWFERAVAAQIDNREAYDRIINAMEPQRGGSYEQMYEIGLRAVRTNRYDIEGPWQLVRIVDVMGMGNGHGWDTLKDPPVYDVVCEVAERYAAAHAKDGKDAYYLTFRAAVSWRVGKYADARRYLNKVGDRLVPDAFKLVCGPGGPTPETAIEYTYAMSDPRATEIKRGDEDAEKDRPNEALAKFKAVLAEKDLEPHARRYLEGRVAYIDWAARLERGEWVDVQPNAGLDGWEKDRWGTWRVDAGGALIGQASTQYRTTLFLRGAKGPRVELSGTVQLIGVGHPTPGVAFRDRYQPTVFANFAGVGVGIWRDGDDMGVTKTDLFSTNCDRPIDFVWTYDRGKFSLKIDGQMLLKERAIEAAAYENAYVGLHVTYGGVKFTKLKVRKIVDRPEKK